MFTIIMISSLFAQLFCDESWGNRKLSDAPKYVLIPAVLLDNKNPDKVIIYS